MLIGLLEFLILKRPISPASWVFESKALWAHGKEADWRWMANEVE